MSIIKLSQYAKDHSITYRSAQNWYYGGLIDGAHKSPTGGIYVTVVDSPSVNPDHVVIYCRVSSSQNKSNLETQSSRLTDYCLAKGYTISNVVKEVGSGINDNRRKLNKLLSDPKVTKIVVEHKDRLTRFGFNYLDILLSRLGVEIEVVNSAESDRDDLIQDFISIITSFCARIYGQRRNKRRTEKLIHELECDQK